MAPSLCLFLHMDQIISSTKSMADVDESIGDLFAGGSSMQYAAVNEKTNFGDVPFDNFCSYKKFFAIRIF